MTSLVLAAALVLQNPPSRPPVANPTAQSVLRRRSEIRVRRRLYNAQAWMPERRTPMQPTPIRKPAQFKEAARWLIENREYLRRIQGH